MKVLVVDTTHGGAILASEFSKKQDFEVFAWDIYHTLPCEVKSSLKSQKIQLVDETFFDDFTQGKLSSSFKNDELMVVAPIHCNLPHPIHMTHHQAVHYFMKDRISVPVIEVTGVKGKTSVVAMLKEIYREKTPLILSSLGVEVVADDEEINLQRNISITPASIITAWELAEELSTAENYNIGICIFESSLGGTGLADVGVITNIAEDYSICQGKSCASKAKKQMFQSEIVVCDYDSCQKIYSKDSDFHTLNQKTNTYSVEKKSNVFAFKSNVFAFNINYGLFETSFQVRVRDLKTIHGKIINTSFECSTFAPAEHHLENALSAVCSSLSMGTPIKTIIRGLKSFKGLPGRTSIKNNYLSGENRKVRVIEEINPGINVTAVKKAVNMIKEYENPALVMGEVMG
ncbi:coenzyme F430 synthase [Methanobacterium petrolearium]|uniref:coenzyme F430 synthase n=1 Tax=Methanobacterium petrolearium TaxID=710190 RepID=UPI003081E11A|nr:coenzyme F430 synthase [Methanobacterium petrolearium]